MNIIKSIDLDLDKLDSSINNLSKNHGLSLIVMSHRTFSLIGKALVCPVLYNDELGVGEVKFYKEI